MFVKILSLEDRHFKQQACNFICPFTYQALTAVAFGNAWATDARECVDDTGEPACEEGSEAEREAFDLCSVLTSVIGKLLRIRP